MESYDLIGNKHFPANLLRESPEIRRALLEGIIDGDGHLNQRDGGYLISAKERPFIDGLVHLTRSLGFSTGNVGTTTYYNENTKKEYTGWKKFFSGAEIDTLQPTLAYKRAPKTNPYKDQRCDSFTVTKVQGSTYYAFTLEGGGRCLMEDFVVVDPSLH